MGNVRQSDWLVLRIQGQIERLSMGKLRIVTGFAGTLTVDIQDDRMFIHWINISTEAPEEQNEIIVKRFERILRRIFE